VILAASSLSSPPLWTLIAAVIGVVSALIGLTAAKINHRSATYRQRNATAATEPPLPVTVQSTVLPPRAPNFVNRDKAMRAALRHIDSGERIVAIEGIPGVGKSAVVAELAYCLHSREPGRDDLSGYSFVWIDGRNTCPSLSEVCREITLQTGDQSLSSVAEREKPAALRSHLARNDTVLLLDNIRTDDLPGADTLRELVRSVPANGIVIASVNSPGALDASRVVLDELEPDHVLQLVQRETSRLSLSNPELFDGDFSTRLRRLVGGNPRMIEWFLRSLVQSAETLDERFAAVESGDGLRDLFMRPWQTLSDDAQAALGACACLGGRAILEQLAVACELPGEVVAAALAEVITLGFLTAARSSGRPDVYTCIYSVQRFAVTQTPKSAVAAFTARLADHYIRFLVRDPENAEAAVPHIDGIKAVLQQLFDEGKDAELQSLFIAVLDILFTLGLFDDRIVTGTLAFESATRAENHRAASLATDVLSSTHAARGEVERAREALVLGELAAEGSGDRGEEVRQMRAAGVVSYKDGDSAGALAAIDGAEEIARATGELETLVNLLGLRTVVCWHLNRFADSRAAAEHGLAVCREISWRRATAYPLRNLAEVALHDGDFPRAAELLREARAVATESSDRRQLARICLTTARMRLLAGEPGPARAESGRAMEQARVLGLPPELEEAAALRRASWRTWWLPPLRFYYRWRRPARLTGAAIGGD
jgi:hypothetical protein